ncbi:MAG: 4-hydroxy-3-methylbut-2-enyl diphosphate reductase, partial [Candidatus Omnitrophica bacterium]|nr:4-hydroxy-3-methylbut-2-enyl diphosphate reductase [Candidatus Omnitrophota bacterium]
MVKSAIDIRIAEHAGFCFGVRRAIRLAQEALKKSKKEKICSIGPIIHNPQEVERFSRMGLEVVGEVDEISKGRVVLIPSHGISPQRQLDLEIKNIELIDTTCPYVKKAQEAAARLSKEGYQVVVVGQKEHPEVKALVEFAGGEGSIVVKDATEATGVPILSEKLGIIAQTTQSKANLNNAISALLERGFSEIKIENTICSDALNRQVAAKNLAEDSDIMLIIGGKESANTRRLFDICKRIKLDTYHIET